MPYGNQDGPSMESAKQEKYDLLHDNPVAKDASGGRPWIAKHFKSSMSPLKDAHSGDSPASAAKPDFPDIDGDGNTSESMTQAAKDKKAGGPEMKYDGMSMKYDGMSKKYPAAGHKNLMEDAGAAVKMDAKVVKKVYKKKNK
jgi:hypothetical protein